MIYAITLSNKVAAIVINASRILRTFLSFLTFVKFVYYSDIIKQ